MTETLPERERLKKEKEEATLAHHKRVAEVDNHKTSYDSWLCVVDMFVYPISNYANLYSGKTACETQFL